MSESVIKYRCNEFIIISVSDGFIVYNTKKEWEKGHSHLRNFKACKNAITFVRNNKIPRDSSYYYLTTLLRISNDEKYIASIKELLEVKKRKTKNNYVNQPKTKYINCRKK